MKKTAVYKRVAVALITLTMSLSALAQEKGDIAIGANLLTGLYNEVFSIGIGPKIFYNVTTPIRLAAELDFSIGAVDNGVSIIYGFQDFSLYGHYLFPVTRGMVYPLVGIGTLKTKAKTEFLGENLTVSDQRIVYTLGGGVHLPISENLFINSELKLKVHDGTHYILQTGIAYKF